MNLRLHSMHHLCLLKLLNAMDFQGCFQIVDSKDFKYFTAKVYCVAWVNYAHNVNTSRLHFYLYNTVNMQSARPYLEVSYFSDLR